MLKKTLLQQIEKCKFFEFCINISSAYTNEHSTTLKIQSVHYLMFMFVNIYNYLFTSYMQFQLYAFSMLISLLIWSIILICVPLFFYDLFNQLCSSFFIFFLKLGTILICLKLVNVHTCIWVATKSTVVYLDI